MRFNQDANRVMCTLVNRAGGQLVADQRVRRFGSHHQKLLVVHTPNRTGRCLAFVGGGAEEHLTTLFPSVRPRVSYLEIRLLDVQPEAEVGALATVLATLLYDDTCRARALAMVESERQRLGERWLGAADGDPRVVERGRALAELAGRTRVRAA